MMFIPSYSQIFNLLLQDNMKTILNEETILQLKKLKKSKEVTLEDLQKLYNLQPVDDELNRKIFATLINAYKLKENGEKSLVMCEKLINDSKELINFSNQALSCLFEAFNMIKKSSFNET